MHYQHKFHAGNFADVFKHVLLCGLLQALSRKDKPWCYVETHAGAGQYDLADEAAARTGEWQGGVGRLAALHDAPEPLASYLRIVAQAGAGYPGSPLFAHALARQNGCNDRLVLCEKIPAIAAQLRAHLHRGGAQVSVHERNGYQAPALLPPAEKRGLLLIDPPYEARDEFTLVGDCMMQAQTRFAAGMIAAWYPLKNRHEAERLRRRMQRELAQPLLDVSFDTGAKAEGQLRACGLLIANPPFGFEREIAPALKILARTLAQGPGAAGATQWLRSD